MSRRRRDGALALVVGVPLGLLGCGVLVWDASYAAFTATTASTANAWRTGAVALSDDDGSRSGAGTAMVDVGALEPGDEGERCIQVRYDGTMASDVRLRAARSGDADLATALEIRVDVGTGGGFASCTGFTGTQSFSGTLTTLASTHPTFETGLASWHPTPGQTRTYRVWYRLPTTAPSTLQGRTAGATLTWEARST